MSDQKYALKALVLLGNLKSGHEPSNTGELVEQVCGYLKKDTVECETVSLFDLNVLPGVKEDMGPGDEWPLVAKKIRACDILILASPVWWTGHCSVLQRAIERMDAFDEEYRSTGISPLYNKVGGVVTTGSEDGALKVIDQICGFFMWLGLTVPPESAAYWTGEVGAAAGQERALRAKNQYVDTLAKKMARNLAAYARLLKEHRPL
ncbi:MAG: NAD(P)H-dependent oxidoreductase [Candidatus Gracilibacteria bacterium]